MLNMTFGEKHLVLTAAAAQTLALLTENQQTQIKDYLLTLQIPAHNKVRPRSPLFRALGAENPPAQIEINQQCYHLLEIYKHDSWAATAIYAGKTDKIVCKFNRQQSIFGIPMRWLGRWLAQRENKFLQLFADLPSIPPYRGKVTAQGAALPHVSAHTYIEGTPLRRYPNKVSDEFFPQLQQILKIIHAQQISYMDLNKQENIIVTASGAPCLIDFQICFHLPKRWPGNSAPMRYLLRILQQSDEFHLRKHYTRLRPDLFTPQALQLARQRPWFLHIYRCIQIPLRTLRRQLLATLGFRSRSGKVTSEAFVEHGIRENPLDHDTVVTIANCRLHLKYDYTAKTIALLSIQSSPQSE